MLDIECIFIKQGLEAQLGHSMKGPYVNEAHVFEMIFLRRS